MSTNQLRTLDFWIIGLTILGSILLYTSGRGNLAYIDALFFAGGANTQAGLNTVDFNLLNTFQQIVVFVLAMTSNPITINSFVVFLRLYWFEKRFQNIAREARQRRGTLSKAKSAGKSDADRIERGVNGRSITVMHSGGARTRMTNDGILLDPVAERDRGEEDDVDPKAIPGADVHDGRRPEIKFANTVTRSDGLGDDATKLPPKRSDEEHIAILQRQRNQSDDEVLRIPGPRDAERGMLPSRVLGDDGADEGEPPSPRATRTGDNLRAGRAATEPRPQAITIAEPPKPSRTDELADEARAVAGALSSLRLRKPRMFNSKEKKLHHDEDAVHIAHGSRPKRRQTFENLRSALSRDKDDMAPYLSWEPTLGRNSAFPGLSEEQREELGGIEYRSLKTLALILTCYFWGFWAFGVVCLVPWILNSVAYGPVVDDASQNRTWWGFFTANSAFTDLGFTLTPDSMNSFNTAVFPLLLLSFLIVIGNTGFPVMLRFVIWFTSLFVPRGTGLSEELLFLLDHPRRCFTLLFPSGATWWLFWLLVILNGLDLIFFIVLDVSAGWPVPRVPPFMKSHSR